MPVAVSTASPGARTCASTSRTRTAVFEVASTLKLQGPLMETVPAGVAVETTAGSSVTDGAGAPPHAVSARPKRALAARPVTDLDDPLHLRMDPAVVRERTHLIEREHHRHVRVDADVERPAGVVGRDGVDLLAAIHDGHGRSLGHLEQRRPVRPIRLLARGLDHLQLVRLEGALGLTGGAAARGDREESEGGEGAECHAHAQDTAQS